MSGIVHVTSNDQHQLTQRLIAYWQQKRGRRPMPEENDIDPDELAADWDYCFLLQSRDIFNIQDYNFTYLGAGIKQAYFDNLFDEHNEFLIGPNAYHLSKHFNKVLHTKAPVMDEGEFCTLQGRCIRFRQVLLPLGDAQGNVLAIFGGMSHKVIEQEIRL
jgi:hypothetical protein